MTRWILLASYLLIVQVLAAQEFEAPKAATVPYHDTLFGEVFPDPYRWLTDKKDPEVFSVNYGKL